MSRIAHCREQARFCRDAASQMGLAADAARLHAMAKEYEAEADALEKTAERDASRRHKLD
jgi:hypothetical protein